MNYIENFGMEAFMEDDAAVDFISMILAEGKAICGYYGRPYINAEYGWPQFIIRTIIKEKEQEIDISGFDTHISGVTKWTFAISEVNVNPKDGDKLARRVVAKKVSDGGGMAVINLVNADVLPSFMKNDIITAQMVGFPELIHYYADEEAYADDQPEMPNERKFLLAEGTMLATGFLKNHDINNPDKETDSYADNYMLIRGTVKSVQPGLCKFDETQFSAFLDVIISTEYGDLEIAHTVEMVEESERDNIKIGAVVYGVFVLSGDVAIEEYSNGIVKDEEHHLSLIRYTFTEGDPERLRSVIADNSQYVSEHSKQIFIGKEDIIARLVYVNGKNPGRKIYAYKATIISVDDGEEELPYNVGKRCVVLAYDEPDNYGGIVFLEMNEDLKITDIVVSVNPRYHFKLDEELKHESIFDGWEIPDTVAIPIVTRAKFHGFLKQDVYAEEVASAGENYISYKDNINSFLNELDVNIDEIEPLILENIFAYLFAKAVESKYSTMIYKDQAKEIVKIVSYSVEEGLSGSISIDVENEIVEKKIRVAYRYGKQFYKDYMIFSKSNPELNTRTVLEQALTVVQQIGEMYASDQLINLIS